MEERKPVKQMASPEKLASGVNGIGLEDDAAAEEMESSMDIVSRWQTASTSSPEKENLMMGLNEMKSFSSYESDARKCRTEVHVEILVHPSR